MEQLSKVGRGLSEVDREILILLSSFYVERVSGRSFGFVPHLCDRSGVNDTLVGHSVFVKYKEALARLEIAEMQQEIQFSPRSSHAIENRLFPQRQCEEQLSL
jgi:hypothetical protein